MKLPLTIALLLPVVLPAAFALPADRVVVVCSCSTGAYREALDGIREALGRDPVVVEPEVAAVARSVVQDPGRVYIAVGRDALHAAAAHGELPVIGALVLHEDAAEGTLPAGRIELDVPPQVLLQEVRRLFPDKTRIGVLIRPGADRSALAARARQLGLALEFAEVSGPAALVKTFLSLKGRVQLALTLPDGLLYNSATVKALVMASLEHNLPLIGFSAAFVRAGAAAGVFADFRDAGRQAAETALRYEPGRGGRAVEPPRRVNVAVNLRVLRLLGLVYAHDEGVTVYR